MSDELGSFKLPITCPGCGRKFEKPLRELETDKMFPCPGCGARFNPDSASFKPIRESIEKLRQQIVKLNATLTIKL